MSEIATRVVDIDPERPGGEEIAQAVRVLRDEGLVAIPTETVYGLAARASSPQAVRRIFEAKGRPATNPLILHVSSVEQARRLARNWPAEAQKLARAFWPGPLTMVVERSQQVDDQVCAGLDTVAIRMPAHPVARAVIEELGEPVAAPSANRYTEVSPTNADHVLDGLGGRIELIVDAGPTLVGLESTLVRLREGAVEILRPGMIDRSQLAKVVDIIDEPGAPRVVDDEVARPSPGLSKRHYSPGVPVCIAASPEFQKVAESAGPSSVIFALRGVETQATVIEMPSEPEEYARELYGMLHRYDADGVDRIIVEMPPDEPRWEAIRDRLRRAAT